MQTISALIQTNEQTSFTELLDNVEGIILGLFIWKQLRSGACQTTSQLTAALVGTYGLAPAVIERDLETFIEELEGNGLVTRSLSEIGAATATAAVDSLPPYETPRLKLSNSLTKVTLSGSSTIATAAIATG